MNTPIPVNEPDEFIVRCAPKKTLSLQVSVTEPDLSKAVREAFELAKSAGRELDLDFNLPPDIGNA